MTGIMEKKMEATIIPWGKILRFYRDNRKDNGSYHCIIRYIMRFYGDSGKWKLLF